ncbi:Phosphate import ATP-binding protein PstB [Rubripirellula amarantea]|uniref:Phosphate import ATP-binding protein PstB n=1 Tax=Rubripirellula amarantea TaxID=2527999 RepID=A0A5C5WXW7_9BACT|nr:phosphate ABC transporter ATP-binding protein PstB [Rubripirellula amarantea]TWT55109.1 Phosphate import ATP-binding protein PstB [Rubripirellula amarantea]
MKSVTTELPSVASTPTIKSSDRTVPGTKPSEISLSIQNLNAWYGDFQALHGISLDIPKNEVTAFIGPSGCGKSTLLRWCNRMNDTIVSAKATGNLQMNDINLLDKSIDVVDLRRRVGIVFQKANPFPKTIFENVAFGPKLHMKLNRSEMEDLIEWSLRKAALWDEVKDRLHKPALGLSGGQQQRLCIARAIAVGPELLLMDEPCSALDPASTLAIEDLMEELREQYTIVIVTHNMQQASRCSDKTAFFFEGRVIEFGQTELVFTKPKNQQTEDYVRGRFG